MRVATWNINGLRARIDFLLHWLDAREPDIVGLQELKLTEEQFPFERLESVGYRSVVHGQKSWNGVAILARDPIEPVQSGLPDAERMGERLVAARVRELTFITAYCPNGKSVEHLDFPRKLEWFDALGVYLRTALSQSRDLILCGDFNLCPEPIDSWNESALNGRIFHTPEERERFRAVLDTGLIDLFRREHPDRAGAKWPAGCRADGGATGCGTSAGVDVHYGVLSQR